MWGNQWCDYFFKILQICAPAASLGPIWVINGPISKNREGLQLQIWKFPPRLILGWGIQWWYYFFDFLQSWAPAAWLGPIISLIYIGYKSNIQYNKNNNKIIILLIPLFLSFDDMLSLCSFDSKQHSFISAMEFLRKIYF